MQEHDATETAWQNGYKAGLEAGKRASLREGTWVYKRVSGTCGCSRCGGPGPGSAALLPVVRGGTEGTGMVNWEQITAFAAWVLWMRFLIWWYLQ